MSWWQVYKALLAGLIIIIGDEIPKNGPEWHELRNGYLPKLDELNNYSNSLKGIVRNMMNSKSELRPSANTLLTNYLQSEIELELKWEKTQNELLKKKIKEYEAILQKRRKLSV